jgi:hypothetical protein
MLVPEPHQNPAPGTTENAIESTMRIVCDRCGTVMFEDRCKIVCSNCGNRFDCSDLNLYFD